MRCILAILAVLLLAAGYPGGTAAAHELRPTVATLVVAPEGRYEIAMQVNIEAALAGIGALHRDTDDSPQAGTYKQLRALRPEALEQKFRAFFPEWAERFTLDFDGTVARPQLTFVGIAPPEDESLARISLVQMSGELPAGAQALRWTTRKGFGNSVIRVKRPSDSEMSSAWVNEGATSEPIALGGVVAPRGTLALLGDYISAGFVHIVPKGLDHILFVLGLYLLSTSWRPLLVQVTSFTVAHSITLALGIYGVVRLPPSIVEPLIALSIVYVAVENLATSKLSPWRPAVVFAFGLLHGLGFAGVLEEIGLPRSDFITALVGFNLGVELGQLAVIGLAWLAVGVWFGRRPWYRTRVVMPCSAVIAAVALYWTVERIFLT